MKGTIVMINQNTGMVATENGDGEYTVFELLDGSSVEIEDEISGDLEALGGETFRNKTQTEDMDVYVQAIHATQEIAKQLVS